MKSVQFKPRFGSCLVFIMISLYLLLSACGGDRSSSDDSSSNSGSIAFSAVWPDAVTQNPKIKARTVDCGASGIADIIATVYTASDTKAATPEPWPCSTPGQTGTISGVSTGSNMRILIEGIGIDSGVVEWEGTKRGFTVSAGQTTDVGAIPMNYIGKTLRWDISNWDEKKWK